MRRRDRSASAGRRKSRPSSRSSAQNVGSLRTPSYVASSSSRADMSVSGTKRPPNSRVGAPPTVAICFQEPRWCPARSRGRVRYIEPRGTRPFDEEMRLPAGLSAAVSCPRSPRPKRRRRRRPALPSPPRRRSLVASRRRASPALRRPRLLPWHGRRAAPCRRASTRARRQARSVRILPRATVAPRPEPSARRWLRGRPSTPG